MKSINRRLFIQTLAAASTLAIPASPARADDSFPSYPVRLIVPAPAGGGYDLTARLISQVLSERLGAPFIVDNRAGAGTNIGTETVVHAPPDDRATCIHHDPEYGTRSAAVIRLADDLGASELYASSGRPCTTPLDDLSDLLAALARSP